MEEIDDSINSIMFFAWMVIVPIYIFFFNEIDFTERVLHIALVAVPYLSFSIFKSITTNIKFESGIKISAFFIYGILVVKHINFAEIFSSSHLLMTCYGIVLIIAIINVIIHATASILRLIIGRTAIISK